MDLGILGILNQSYSQAGPVQVPWREFVESQTQSGLPGVLGGGIGAGLGALTGNPIISAILMSVGSQAATSLLGSLFGGQSPAEAAALQSTEAGRQLIPQLQAQARGEPTAATEAQQRQLQQATTRMQQSYAASARRSGLGAPTLGGGQPTVTRAQQGRFQEARLGAMGDIMARSQVAAQQQLGGMYAQGLQTQRQIEMQESAARGEAISNITKMYQNIEQMKARQQYDADLMAFYNKLLQVTERQLEAF